MSNVYFRSVDLAGGGAGVGFTLGPEQNVFTGADLAAAELARDNYFTANPSNLAQYNADTALNIRLEYTDGTTNVVTYQVRNSAGDDWIDNQSFQAVQGPAGADGVDGNNFEFVDSASRDTFFASRPDLLVTNLPIIINVDGTTIMNQIWSGATAPASYVPATDAVFFVDASVMAATSSFFLGGIHSMSSGGENVFFQNSDSDVAYAPPWQSLGNHSDPAQRNVDARPSAREYGDLTFEEPVGPVATSGSVAYDTTFTLPRNESVFGIKVVSAETYDGMLEYRVTRMNTVVVAYDNFQNVDVAPGDDVIFWFPFPVEGREGIQVDIELLKPDGTHLLTRPRASDAALTYTEIRFREWVDRPLAFQIDNFDYDSRATALTATTTINAANRDTYNNLFLYTPTTLSGAAVTVNIAADADLDGFDFTNLNTGTLTLTGQGGVTINGQTSITLSDQFDGGRFIADPETDDAYIFLFEALDSGDNNYADSVDLAVSGQDLSITIGRTGALADLTDTVTLPTDVDNYVDTADLSLSGQDLTITLSRTGVLADLTDTVTLPTGGTTPTASVHGFAFSDIPPSVDVDTVLTTTPTVAYSISNHAQVQSLTVSIDGTDYSLTVPSLDGQHSEVVTLAQAIPTNTARTISNTLTGVNTDGGALNTLNYNVSVITPVAVPDVYFGLSSTNNPATVVLGTLTTAQRNDPMTIATGTTTANDYFIILAPNDDDISTITDTVLNQDVTDIFTRTADVRTDNSITYNSYVIGPLNAGVDEQYILRF